jgi:hypothetical protein
MFRTGGNFIPGRPFLALRKTSGTPGLANGGRREQMGLVLWTDDTGTGRPSDARVGLWT